MSTTWFNLVTFVFAASFLLVVEAKVFAQNRAGDSLEAYLAKIGYTGFPLRKNDGNNPLIEVELNGRRHTFLADTGCSMTTLQPATAAGLKTLGDMGATLQDSFLGTITNAEVAIMPELRLGNARLLNQPGLVTKLDMDFIRLSFDGILGLDFFFRNFCVIDCRARRLYLRAGPLSEQVATAFQETLHRSGFAEAPFEIKNDLISIECKVNGQPVKLLVDTGDSVSVLDQSLAGKLHLTSVRLDDPDQGSLIRRDVSGDLVGFNRIGAHRTWVAMLDSLQIGPRTWKHLSYGVTDLKAWKLLDEAHPERGLQGFFGQELLASHGVLIDFANRKLWFAPERKP